MRRALPLVTLLVACSKSEPPPPERTEPWPAQPVASAGSGSGPEQKARFKLDDRCELALELPAKEATPRGNIRVTRGELELDLMNLERSRGTIEIDVGSLVMNPERDDGGENWTAEALAWLDVGENRPEAERERQRWASFALTELSELSAPAAHAGKRHALAAAAERPPAGELGDAAPPVGEERSVTATVTGALTLHGFRVERRARVRALFRYAAPAVPGALPHSVRLELARPVPISLEAHDIKPRDASGIFVAQRSKWLGVRVGRQANVSGWLSATLVR
jgi:hypothetical protein